MATTPLKGGLPTNAYQINFSTAAGIDQTTGPHASGYFWDGPGHGASSAQDGQAEPVPRSAADTAGFTQEGYL